MPQPIRGSVAFASLPDRFRSPSMAASGMHSPGGNVATAATVAPVTESRDAGVFALEWTGRHAAPSSTFSGVAMSSQESGAWDRRSGRHGGGARVYMEQRDGSFVPKRQHDAQQSAAKANGAWGRAGNVLAAGARFLTAGDDAADYEPWLARVVSHTQHLLRMLSALSFGVAAAVLIALFYDTPNAAEGFVRDITVVVPAPTPVPTPAPAVATPAPAIPTGGSASSSPAPVAPVVVEQTYMAGAYGGRCGVSRARCAVLSVYARFYQMLTLFFLSSSLVGAFLSMLPFAHDLSMTASHRMVNRSRAAAAAAAVSNRQNRAQLQDAAAQAQFAAEQAESSQLGRYAVVLRGLLNVATLSHIGCLIATIVAQTVEFDRRESRLIVELNDSDYERIVGVCIARCALHFMACALSLVWWEQEAPTLAPPSVGRLQA